MITKTLKTELKLKDGTVYPVGAKFNLTWESQITLAEDSTGRKVRLSASRLHKYFAVGKPPTINTLERWSNDGVAKSVLGKRVEPDGIDSDGSPSWLLVMGFI